MTEAQSECIEEAACPTFAPLSASWWRALVVLGTFIEVASPVVSAIRDGVTTGVLVVRIAVAVAYVWWGAHALRGLGRMSVRCTAADIWFVIRFSVPLVIAAVIALAFNTDYGSDLLGAYLGAMFFGATYPGRALLLPKTVKEWAWLALAFALGMLFIAFNWWSLAITAWLIKRCYPLP